MAILKHLSFSKALSVMHLLEGCEKLHFQLKRHIHIGAYQNGREQGITVWDYDRKLTYFVAEHRNSDQMVTYRGEHSMQGIPEDAYGHRNFFGNIEDCVDWIVGDLLEGE